MKKGRAPGRFAKVNGKQVRCAKREFGCTGCVFDDLLLCPCLTKNPNAPDCIGEGLIFKKAF